MVMLVLRIAKVHFGFPQNMQMSWRKNSNLHFIQGYKLHTSIMTYHIQISVKHMIDVLNIICFYMEVAPYSIYYQD